MYDSRVDPQEPAETPRDYRDGSQTPPPSRERRNRHVALWTIGVLAVLLLGVIGWWQLSEERAERRFAAERAQMQQSFAAERQAAVTAAEEALRARIENAYRLFGTSLGWAIRSAMLRDNLDQVDQYFTQLVQSRQVRVAALAGTDGKILLASDRNLQESDFASHFPEALLKVREVTVVSPEAGAVRYMAIPILGLSEQLGVAVLAFDTAPQAPASS